MNCIGCEKELAPFGATYFPEYPENPLYHSCTAAKLGIDDEDREWEILHRAIEKIAVKLKAEEKPE